MKALVAGLAVCSACALAFLAGRASTVVAGPAPIAASVTTVALAQPEDAPELPPEMQAMMDANKPGPEHEILARMAGDWKAVMASTMPGEEAMNSEGTMSVGDIFDGKFMGQEYHGEFMGMPFDGLGVYGYSTMTGTYQYCWFDSFGTHIYYAEGEAGDDGDSLVYHGKEPNPEAPGELVDYRDDIVFASDDEYTMTRTYITPEGEFEGFHITFTRE